MTDHRLVAERSFIVKKNIEFAPPKPCHDLLRQQMRLGPFMSVPPILRQSYITDMTELY